VPTVCQFFFLVNFLFSRNPVVETYSFVHQERVLATKNGPPKMGKMAAVRLENEQYADYPWFTLFFDFEAMENAQQITYTFEDGLFGLRVLKSHQFAPPKNSPRP